MIMFYLGNPLTRSSVAVSSGLLAHARASHLRTALLDVIVIRCVTLLVLPRLAITHTAALYTHHAVLAHLPCKVFPLEVTKVSACVATIPNWSAVAHRWFGWWLRGPWCGLRVGVATVRSSRRSFVAAVATAVLRQLTWCSRTRTVVNVLVVQTVVARVAPRISCRAIRLWSSVAPVRSSGRSNEAAIATAVLAHLARSPWL